MIWCILLPTASTPALLIYRSDLPVNGVRHTQVISYYLVVVTFLLLRTSGSIWIWIYLFFLNVIQKEMSLFSECANHLHPCLLCVASRYEVPRGKQEG